MKIIHKKRKHLSRVFIGFVLALSLLVTLPAMIGIYADNEYDQTFSAEDSLYQRFDMYEIPGSLLAFYCGGTYGSHMTFTYNAETAGEYNLTLRYVFGETERIPGSDDKVYLSVYDNGNFVKELTLDMTGTWDNWTDSTFKMNLDKGVHYITLWHENTKSAGGPNVDYLKIGETQLEAETAARQRGQSYFSGVLAAFYGNGLSAATFVVTDVPRDGYYDVTMNFQNGNPEAADRDAKLAVIVNGKYVKDTLLPPQESWSVNASVTERVYLNKGTNTIKYWRFDMSLEDPMNPDKYGSLAAPNLISINVKNAPVDAVPFEIISGTSYKVTQNGKLTVKANADITSVDFQNVEVSESEYTVDGNTLVISANLTRRLDPGTYSVIVNGENGEVEITITINAPAPVLTGDFTAIALAVAAVIAVAGLAVVLKKRVFA